MSSKPNQERHKKIVKWWKDLKDNKGERARLARLQDPRDAVFHPSCNTLMRILTNYNRDNVCVLACLLASVKDTNAQYIAVALASKKGESALYSPLRLRRLLSYEDPVELFPAMYRVIKHLKGKVNIADLSDSMLFWNAKQRRDWAARYYNAGQDFQTEDK